MDTQSVTQLIVILILILLSGFFSSAETALTMVNRMRLRTLVEEDFKHAATLQKVIDQYGNMLSTILIGNNIVNISASAMATTLAIRAFGNYAVGLATGILTIVVLIFGEIVPKTLASTNSEKIALAYSSTIYMLMKIMTPVIKIIDGIANTFFRLFRIDADATDSGITESELKTIVDVSHEGGIIETEEREMIYNVFDFGDSLAKDIMIPRIDMTTISIDSTYQELLETFKESMYTRIPVYENDTANIIGLVNVKDLLLVENTDEFSIRSILRDAYYTYEFKKTADLLMEMRSSASSVAFVLNEYGATVGLITLEDLLEEIVGEIRDEYDEDEKEFIKQLSDREYLITGSMKLDDINDALKTDFDSENYDSIGGIMIEFLDKLPQAGESVVLEDGTTLTADSIKQNRIEWVRMLLPLIPEEQVIPNDESKESMSESEIES
ncbi:MAG: hemolysin family protein [Lachnospiraceae bacterium]|nr:hemolysin family protein [Lachnospiraceae bacterium]MDD3661214.1 hemolysin family protein [Lachnospiraceae bacterium]